MLPKYYKYMKKNARRSLLTRYCGMYQVRVGNEEKDAHGTKYVLEMSVCLLV